jgi:hypothetical protein
MLVMSCPCGCGDELPINLDGRAGPAWSMYRTRAGLTIYPSVWRESGCESHFVLWRDEIYLFGRREDDLELASPDEDQSTLLDDVLARLLPDHFVRFSELAEALDAVPWDVLMACRSLVRRGLAREGAGRHRGTFAKAST